MTGPRRNPPASSRGEDVNTLPSDGADRAQEPDPTTDSLPVVPDTSALDDPTHTEETPAPAEDPDPSDDEPIDQDEAWNPLDDFPRAPWFYLTWIAVYVLWVVASVLLLTVAPSAGPVDSLVNVMAAFAGVSILGALASLVGFLFIEKMTPTDAVLTAVKSPFASVTILVAAIFSR